MYESMNVTLPDTQFGGFCLTCRQQSDPGNIILYSIDCNEKARGHCIMSDGGFLITLSSTFALYWMQCRSHNFYITGTTNRKFCQRNRESWTGLRKYKINIFFIDNRSCYIIEILQDIIRYKKIVQKMSFSYVNKRLSTFYASNTSVIQKTQQHRHSLVKHHGLPGRLLHRRTCLPEAIQKVTSISLPKIRLQN